MHAQLRTIYCNTYVHTFHVCLCLLALTFVCNSTYLLKCSLLTASISKVAEEFIVVDYIKPASGTESH